MASPTVWEQAPLNPLRKFTKNGVAITVGGFNRYTNQPVNSQGLTKEAFDLGVAFRQAFPDTPTKNNYAVDRKANHSLDPDAPLSDHARGEALDFMIPGYDGNKANISDADRAHGMAGCAWLDTQMQGALKKGLRNKWYREPRRISYYLFNQEPNGMGFSHYAENGARRPLRSVTAARTHRSHIHVSIVPVDRSKDGNIPATPTKPERRWLRYGARGMDVVVVQVHLGGSPDGIYGVKTRARVKAFQKRNGLKVDGVVGPATWAAIDAGKK